MKNSYIAYLESQVELQALYTQRLETYIILDTTFRNTIGGIRLGEAWLIKHHDSILLEIIQRGGIENAVKELKKFI